MNNDWKPYNWYCPNCSKLVTAYKNSKGEVKVSCPRCKVIMFRRAVSRRSKDVIIEMKLPREQLDVV